MTSKEIQKILDLPATQYNPRHVPTVLWQIALQLARLNEQLQPLTQLLPAINDRNRLMLERYLALTAVAVKQKAESRKQKTDKEMPSK